MTSHLSSGKKLMDSNMTGFDYHGYRLTPVYQQIDPPLAQQIMDLWKRNKVIADPNEIQRRVADVVYTAQAPTGELVGVSTVYIGALTKNNVYFFYRMFIQADHRRAGMMRRLTEATRYYLQKTPLKNKPLGMIIVTENTKLMKEGMRRMFERHGYVYMGRTPRNLDMWKADF